MKQEQNNLDQLIYELGSSGVLTRADDRQIIAFCCACCRLIWDELPNEARHSLEVAERYANGDISTEDLKAERMRLWAVWNAMPNRDDNSAPDVNAIRAVICCLYERGYADEIDWRDPNYEYDALTHTMDFCNRVKKTDRQMYYQALLNIFGYQKEQGQS